MWLNQQWLKLLPPAVVAEQLVDFLAARGVQLKAGDPRLERVVMAFRERARSLQEMAEMALKYFQHGVTLDEKAAAKHLTAESRPLLTQVREQVAALPQWSAAALDEVVKKVSEQAGVGMGKVAQPVRVAATGGTVSPGIGETLELLGREETLHRLDAALARP
jgi:glutamyl-tRNA synthetase